MPLQVASFTTNVHTLLSIYATTPIEYCINRVNQFVLENTGATNIIGKASGSLVSLGVVVATAAAANRAWNKKCSSKTDRVVLRSFAILLSAVSCYVILGTVTASNTERKLLALASVIALQWNILRTNLVKKSSDKESLSKIINTESYRAEEQNTLEAEQEAVLASKDFHESALVVKTQSNDVQLVLRLRRKRQINNPNDNQKKIVTVSKNSLKKIKVSKRQFALDHLKYLISQKKSAQEAHSSRALSAKHKAIVLKTWEPAAQAETEKQKALLTQEDAFEAARAKMVQALAKTYPKIAEALKIKPENRGPNQAVSTSEFKACQQASQATFQKRREFLAQAILAHQEIRKKIEASPDTAKKVLEKIKNFKKEHLEEEASIEELARVEKEEGEKRLARIRAAQKEARAKHRQVLKTELLKTEQQEELDKRTAQVRVNLNRTNAMVFSRNANQRMLQEKRTELLDLYGSFYVEVATRNNEKLKQLAHSQLPRATAPEKSKKHSTERNSLQSILEDHKYCLIGIESELKKTQEFIINDYSILKSSIYDAIAYHREIGGSPEDVKRVWDDLNKEAKKLEAIANQTPIDLEQVKIFSELIDLCDLRLKNEIKLSANLQQQIMLRGQAAEVSKKIAELEKNPQIQILSKIVGRKKSHAREEVLPVELKLDSHEPGEVRVDPSSYLFEIDLSLLLCKQREKQLQESIEKTNNTYEKLKKEAESLGEKLQAASQQFEKLKGKKALAS
jgi:hypothetical protein